MNDSSKDNLASDYVLTLHVNEAIKNLNLM